MRISGKRRAHIGLVSALCEGVLIAPLTYSGTMKASLFEEWFKDKLLECLPKECVIIMDNASFHRKIFLYNIAEKHSQSLIFLPPYSLEYNKSVRTLLFQNRLPRNAMFSIVPFMRLRTRQPCSIISNKAIPLSTHGVL